MIRMVSEKEPSLMIFHETTFICLRLRISFLHPFPLYASSMLYSYFPSPPQLNLNIGSYENAKPESCIAEIGCDNGVLLHILSLFFLFFSLGFPKSTRMERSFSVWEERSALEWRYGRGKVVKMEFNIKRVFLE